MELGVAVKGISDKHTPNSVKQAGFLFSLLVYFKEMITLFVIEESFIPEIIWLVGSVFDSVKPLLILIFALFMGFYIVEKIIESLQGGYVEKMKETWKE